jgi:hypothetical protein
MTAFYMGFYMTKMLNLAAGIKFGLTALLIFQALSKEHGGIQ